MEWLVVGQFDFLTLQKCWVTRNPLRVSVCRGRPLGKWPAFAGHRFALIWWRPEGVTAAPVWLNIALHVATYALTAAFWARWQAQTHYAKLPDGALDPMYVRAMSTHWIRATLITLNGLAVFWMVIQHLSSKAERLP